MHYRRMGSSSSLNIVLLVVTLIVTFSSSTVGDDTCKTSKMMKRYMNGLYSCAKSLKFKDEHDKAAKMTCVLKCVLMTEGILNKNGQVEKGLVAKYLDREAPEFMKTKGVTLFGQCIDEHGPELDPADEFCRSYDPMVKCFVWASIQIFMNEFT